MFQWIPTVLIRLSEMPWFIRRGKSIYSPFRRDAFEEVPFADSFVHRRMGAHESFVPSEESKDPIYETAAGGGILTRVTGRSSLLRVERFADIDSGVDREIFFGDFDKIDIFIAAKTARIFSEQGHQADEHTCHAAREGVIIQFLGLIGR